MATLLSQTITTANTGAVGSTFQFVGCNPRNLTVQFKFTYGSGGTSVDAYLQTSLDSGVTWVDIAQLSGTTSSLTKVYNLTSSTPKTTAVTPTDGSLSANTSLDGIIGSLLRVKYTTVGTYAGSTTLKVDVQSTDRVSPVI